MRIRVLVLAGALALLLAACGSDSSNGEVVMRLITPATAGPGSAGGAPSQTPIPPPQVLLSTSKVYQAGAVLVSVVGEVTGGEVTFLDRPPLKLTQGTQSMYTFVGIDTNDAPGTYPLKIDFVLKNGTTGTITEQITVLETQWTVDSLTFDDDKSPLLEDPRALQNEQELLAAIYSQYTPMKLWEGSWELPIGEAPVTAHYGEQRSTNGGPVQGHHSGTDFGADMGTPVHATNNGKVAMARQTHLHGNMVIIDHGGGLFSGYAHLSSFAVAEGQTVAKGDVIGYVGNTGLSTGSHLHWEMSEMGVLLDALRFVDGSNGF